MIDAVNNIFTKLETVLQNAAYVVAGFVTLSVFLKKKAFGPTLGTGIIAFLVAWTVQKENLTRLGNLFSQDLPGPRLPTPPLGWLVHAAPVAAHGLALAAAKA